jgi:GNAT superfamily N-acetyltransferase
MHAKARLSDNAETLSLRIRYRQEMNCQLVHDSIHRRRDWTLSYMLQIGGEDVGFGSVAVGGPWKERPAVFEFYVLPEKRTQAFYLFEALLEICGASFMEIQSNDTLLAVMLHTYAGDIASEKVVFHDQRTTALDGFGATLCSVTSEDEIRKHIEERQGGPEWVLEADGQVAGKGGILFHYNRPYGDIYMEIDEPFRRRGLGAYLVQELKRFAYQFGVIPCARCGPTNVASRNTLQKAGFVPFAHMLTGAISSQGSALSTTISQKL